MYVRCRKRSTKETPLRRGDLVSGGTPAPAPFHLIPLFKHNFATRCDGLVGIGEGGCACPRRAALSSSFPGKSPPLFGARNVCSCSTYCSSDIPPFSLHSLSLPSPTPSLPLSFFQARSVEAAPKSGGHAKTTTRAEYD